MDTSIQRALNDKLYEKRKVGALEYVLARASCFSCRGYTACRRRYLDRSPC